VFSVITIIISAIPLGDRGEKYTSTYCALPIQTDTQLLMLS